MNVSDCRLIQLPKVADPRGNLTFIESHVQVPFETRRVYYLYDVPAGSERGGHAHRELEQLIIAVSGSFDILLDDGTDRVVWRLNKPFEGLYIAQMVWRELANFSSGAVCLVLASTLYSEADYYRNYADFLSAKEQLQCSG